MTKKEILVTVVVLVLLIGGSIGAYLVWNHYDAWKKHQESMTVNPSTTDTTQDTGQQSSLSVDTGSSQNNPAQMSSGLSQSNTNGSSSQSSADSFSQYEKYKDNQLALYGEIQVGTGAEAANGKKISITYIGRLTDGTIFDQSKGDDNGKKQPFAFTFGAQQVIPGMEQGVAGMKVGGSRRIVVPPAVGYGSQAVGAIPPNSVLIFDVQLINVE